MSDDSRADYTFSTGGRIRQTGANGASVDPSDTINGTTSIGHVYGGSDSYKFFGELSDLDLDSTADAFLDGKKI